MVFGAYSTQKGPGHREMVQGIFGFNPRSKLHATRKKQISFLGPPSGALVLVASSSIIRYTKLYLHSSEKHQNLTSFG
jgi:hypothetical protein